MAATTSPAARPCETRSITMPATITPSGAAAPTADSVPYRKLRVLIVDDNRINLSVLSTLLKRRFGNLLEGQAVAVDSGLKAIQLLRTHVFDLILMDIQMPFLSGLDATIRIRGGEDGVLEANRNAHIVAVTTAVGDEPELAYRRAGMDGMIGKPVRFQDIQHYLCPLAHEAYNAASVVQQIEIDGESVMPPLPPALSRSDRLFYLPANATIRAPQPDICQGADFEKMLRSQTRASLRNSGAMAVARSGNWTPTRSNSTVDRRPRYDINEPVDAQEHISEEESAVSKGGSPKRSPSVKDARMLHLDTDVHKKHSLVQSPTSVDRSDNASLGQHRRSASLTYSKRMLSQQIAREMKNMAEQSDSGGSSAMKTKTKSTTDKARPRAVHRISSPAWLITRENDESESLAAGPESPLSLATTSLLAPTSYGFPGGPSSGSRLLRARMPHGQGIVHLDADTMRDCLSRTNISAVSSPCSDEHDYDGSPLSSSSPSRSGLRRDSQQSGESGTSDASSVDLATPASESPAWPSGALPGKMRHVGGRPKHYYSRIHSKIGGGVEPWSDDTSDIVDLAHRFHGATSLLPSTQPAHPRRASPGDGTVRVRPTISTRPKAMHGREDKTPANFDVPRFDLAP